MGSGSAVGVLAAYWAAIAVIMGLYVYRVGVDAWFIILLLILVVIGAGLTIIVYPTSMAAGFSGMFSDEAALVINKRVEERLGRIEAELRVVREMVSEVKRELEE